MDKLEHSASDIQKRMGEKEARIKDLLGVTDELIARDIADGRPEDSHHFYASATYREAHDNDRIGILSFTRAPHIDPNSFFKITYSEHGWGGDYNETNTSYALTRTNDGDTLVQVSDAISTDGFHAAMAEANDFADQTKGHDNDLQMLAQAREGLEAEVHDAITQEMHEAALSLRNATDDDLTKLEEILTIAKDRTDWDQIDHDKEMSRHRAEDAEINATLATDPVRMSRIKKLARQAGRALFTSRR